MGITLIFQMRMLRMQQRRPRVFCRGHARTRGLDSPLTAPPHTSGLLDCSARWHQPQAPSTQSHPQWAACLSLEPSTQTACFCPRAGASSHDIGGSGGNSSSGIQSQAKIITRQGVLSPVASSHLCTVGRFFKFNLGRIRLEKNSQAARCADSSSA